MLSRQSSQVFGSRVRLYTQSHLITGNCQVVPTPVSAWKAKKWLQTNAGDNGLRSVFGFSLLFEIVIFIIYWCSLFCLLAGISQ